MASMATIRPLSLSPLSLRRHCRHLPPSVLPTPLSNLKKPPSSLSSSSIGLSARRSASRFVAVASAQSNFLKVIQKAWRVGKDGVEAGSNLIPDTVPRPVARVSVAVVAATVALFLLKSFISTALFVLAMMGALYFIFIAFNNGEGPRGDSSSSSTSTEEESLEEARRIMEKYK
ncbi:uncharacterized protein M6B38_300070 [Iris pallida]|uniref:Uncharacterized protein n=1 Tax=Iris pallida TaxID=29817 RepID=A0AAX6HS33_IRIPA|nr:uncharacterized protein M6B38_300070 [Iris pallida]